jgi:hypothetical protein
MLLKRQWGFVAGSAITVLVLVGLCFVVGPDVCRQYFEVSRTMGSYIETSGTRLDRLHSWLGFFRLLLPHVPLGTVQILTLFACGATVAVLAWLLWGPLKFGQPAFALQFSGLVLATLLLSPHLYTYDLGALLLPMILLTLHATGFAAIPSLPGQPMEALPSFRSSPPESVTPEKRVGVEAVESLQTNPSSSPPSKGEPANPVLTLPPSLSIESQRRMLLWLTAVLYVLGGFSVRLAAVIPVQASVLAMFALLFALAWVVARPANSPLASASA